MSEHRMEDGTLDTSDLLYKTPSNDLHIVYETYDYTEVVECPVPCSQDRLNIADLCAANNVPALP